MYVNTVQIYPNGDSEIVAHMLIYIWYYSIHVPVHVLFTVQLEMLDSKHFALKNFTVINFR